MSNRIPLADRIISVSSQELIWQYRADKPYFSLTAHASKEYGGSMVYVDPHPCYAHSAVQVFEWAAKVEDTFPLPVQPYYYLLPLEDVGRTNGHASFERVYDEKGSVVGVRPYIVLSGKRIPPMPSMTRYLVAHEYGHCVQYSIEAARGELGEADPTPFIQDYQEMRFLGEWSANPHRPLGADWHRRVGEVVANDFRICMTNTEPDFWPHDFLMHPCNTLLPSGGSLHDYWQVLSRKYAWKEESLAV